MSATAELGRILDALNAWGTLEETRRALAGITQLINGPKAFTSSARSLYPYAGAVIWKRAPGYHGYKTLTLIGVWALHDFTPDRQVAPSIVIGIKRLAYRPAFYDAEAYMKLIRRDYTLYYQDDYEPPLDPTAQQFYTPARRLELRGWLAQHVRTATTNA